MKKSLIVFAFLCFLLSVATVFADDAPTGFKVNYLGEGCLKAVPTDDRLYQPGETVTVLFEPVQYNGYTFYGFDMSGDGDPEFGYSYRTFVMPDHDVNLRAICIGLNYVPSRYVPNPKPNDGFCGFDCASCCDPCYYSCCNPCGCGPRPLYGYKPYPPIHDFPWYFSSSDDWYPIW